MPQKGSPETSSVTLRIVAVVRSVISTDSRIKSKTDFANAIGVDKVAITKWSKGTANCTLENVFVICRRFRINPMYLILGVGDMHLDSGKDVTKNRMENQIAELEIRISNLEFTSRKPGTKNRNKAGKINKKRQTVKI